MQLQYYYIVSMKRNLLTSNVGLFSFASVKSFTVVFTFFVLLGFGTLAKVSAQCIGPYQTFESFVAATTPSGWSFNTGVTSFSAVSSTSLARNGLIYLQQTGTNSTINQTTLNFPSVITTSYVNPKTVSFYINKSAGAGAAITYDLQYSPDGGTTWYTIPSGTNTVNGVSITATIPTLPTTAGVAGWTQVSATFNTDNPSANYRFRIRDTRGTPSATFPNWNPVTGSFWIDDFSVTTYNTSPNDNTIVVPEWGASGSSITCNPLTVPIASSNITYKFYDQGGLSDNYNKNRTQTIYFAPASSSEKVQLTYKGAVLDAFSPLTSITIYNGSGTGGTVLGTITSSAYPAVNTNYTSTDSTGYITVVIANSNGAGSLTATQTGFDFDVKCIAPPNITNLLTPTAGCAGANLTITGTNLGGASSVTIGGVAATIVSNTATQIVVTPGGATTSGTVTVTTSAGSGTSASAYSINAIPTISVQPSGTQTLCVGGSATALSVTAAAGSGTITKYEWYSNTSASTVGATLVATNNSSLTTDNYTPSTASAGTLYYYVVVTNSNGCSVTSSFTGAITVNAPVAITTDPSASSQTVCVGGSITALSVVATGGGLSYQWYSNSTNSNTGGTLIGGATSASYTPSNASAMATTYYYCEVSNGAPCNSSVNSAVSGGITVLALPATVTVSGGGTFCTSATITASNGGSGTIYFQGLTSGGTSTGTASASQNITTSGTYYFRAFNGTCWGTEGSATVTILAVPGAPSVLAATSILSNGFTANWNSVGGASGYFLDVATDAGFTSLVSGYSNLAVGNVTTYAVTGLNPSTTYFYRVRATNGTCTGSSSGSVSCTTLALTYCTPSGSGFSQDPQGITNFNMGTINNTTGIETGNYGNYTSFSTNVYVSATVPFSVTYRTGFTYDTAIWVDWNNDGDFDDTGELVYSGTSASSVPATLSGTITIPTLNSNSASTIGSHRMRVGGIDGPGFTGGALTPCRNGAYQAYEDYTIVVIPVPSCTVTTPSSLTTASVSGTSATLVWSDPAMIPSTVYNYYVSTTNTAPPADGSDPVGMGTVTGALTANITGLTLGVQYYFWVRVKCDSTNYSAWIGSATFITSNLDVVTMTNGSLTTCNAKFYDSGGFGSNYASNETFTYTFTPSAGNSLKIVFNSFSTENNYDGLMIYNGPNTASPVIPSGLPAGTNATTAPANSYYGTTSPGTIYSPVNGSITFQFKSDGSLTSSGWDATITCVSLPTITSFTPTSACAGATPVVTITGTNFTGATSVKFNGVDASSFTVVNSTTITATLPATATTGVITVSNANASGTSSTSFTINPIPNVPNAGADVAICNGQSSTLTATYTPTSNSLLTTTIGGNGCSNGNMFNITTGSSPITITAFDITPNLTAVQNVTVYYKVGTYVGSETTSGAWTLLGTYVVNGVDKTIINMPVTNLAIPASSTYGIYINYNAAYTTGANTYSNADITLTAGAGLCAAFGSVNASRTFNGRVYYQLNLPITYSWSPSTGLSATTGSSVTANPTSTQTYLVTASANGCTSSSDNVIVTVNPIPTTTITTPASNVCANSVVAVNVTGTATSYTWTSSVANTLFSDSTGSTAYVGGTNASTVYVKTTSTATITVTGANATGCSSTANVTFTVVTKTFSGGLWTPGGPPANDGTENLVFAAGTYNSSASLSACSCTVSGATVTFNNGHNLSLLNGLTVTSGSLTFNSGASLLQTNNVANSGNIIYRRDSQPCFKYDYTYWSSPVASQTLIGLSPNTHWSGFFDYNPSIANWQQSNSASAMTVGKGYLIRVPDTYPVSPASPTVFTATFTGVPNNGDISLNVVHNPSSQLNLIGNPYPSAMSASAFITDSSFSSLLGGSLYFWTHNTNLNLSTGQYTNSDYAVWNMLGGTSASSTIGSGNNAAPTGNIVSGQGFFVTTLASGTGVFKNSMRTGGATNANANFYRNSDSGSASAVTTSEVERHRIWLDISNSGTAFKQILVGYIQDGTDGIDRLFDGELFDVGNEVVLYTKVQDKKLSIQGRGLTFVPTDTFALGYKTTIADTFTINLSNFDGLFDGQDIFLEDKLLNVIHDLKASAYTFMSGIGTFEDRFVLRFTNQTLGVPVFSDNTVMVYKQNEALMINSGAVPMQEVTIYDITGRLLASKKAINTTQTSFVTLPTTNQVLLVQITAETGEKVLKKIQF